jgi:hypothetical protein
MEGANVPVDSLDADYPQARFRIILVKETQ